MQEHPHRPGNVATSGKVARESGKVNKGPFILPLKEQQEMSRQTGKENEVVHGWGDTGMPVLTHPWHTLEMLHPSGRATAVIILGFHI